MNIAKIEGIGSVYAAKLSEHGIKTTEVLLKVATSRKGRQDLAEKTDISALLILEWVNRADLMCVKGIGEEYNDLLEAAGVDTIKELAHRRPENLYKALLETNKKSAWYSVIRLSVKSKAGVSQAKVLPPSITH